MLGRRRFSFPLVTWGNFRPRPKEKKGRGVRKRVEVKQERKVEGRAPHEPRAGPALRVVPATPRGDLIPSAPSRTLPSLSLFLSPTVNINLGRLHLYLMLPISSLILLPPLTPPRVFQYSVLLSHLRGLHLAFFISRETHHPAESRRGTTRRGAPQAQPRRGVGFIVPLVMDSHDAVRHRRPV